MTIYQVLDEHNRPVFEAQHFTQAQQEADVLNRSSDEHYFFVEKAVTSNTH